MFYKLVFLIFIVVSCGSSIDDANCHKAVNIRNDSNKIIYFEAGGDSGIISYNSILGNDYFKILPGVTKKDVFGRDRGCYEELFAENNNKLYYLLFDEQVLLNNTWEKIRTDDLVLKRYSFTLQEMQAANWTIVYDGN